LKSKKNTNSISPLKKEKKNGDQHQCNDIKKTQFEIRLYVTNKLTKP